ncbi:Outer membrane receptor proteins, mostly Fe transport [Draconibacterium orientale]|uniref:Outer membrane receptor proteins, mostly Fe transport n=1 Tax=Draconibacterium orientale TaxID=1168034 RepID=A0A1I0HCP8_9BACT|nr:TonB-dependent receptor [Draconibacterium orientale]SET80639.1 Outer membrane receptor proteins, mostly Fe transport [Draconibacterium orientale]
MGKYFLILFFMAVMSVSGQNTNHSSVYGKIISDDGSPLVFASVVINGTAQGTLTNEKGEFEIHVPYGKHKVSVSFIGYGKASKTIETSAANRRAKLDFVLKESAETINEVIVSGKSRKTELETQGFAMSAVETEEISLRSVQANELLNTTAGVKIRQNGGLGSNVEYSLNGLSGSAVRIFIDGIPISTYGSSFNLSSIPPSMIKQIEVYKGVVPGHLADDALGGAINIQLHKKARTSFNASVSYGSFNTFQTSANGTYRFDKSGLTVKTSLFHNYSDNDYKVSGRSVVVTGLGGVQTPVTARRFNDAYRSTGGMVQIGFIDVKWADQFFVGVTGSDDYKEIQHGAFLTITPYKDRFMESDALLANLSYQKTDLFIRGLDLNVNGLYGKRNRALVDTLAWAYSWNGERAIDFRGNEYRYSWGSQQEGGPTLSEINRNVSSIRTGLSYTINPNHRILLNHVFSGIDREDSDEMRSVMENTFSGTRDLRKNIYSFTYEFNAFDNRLKTNVFGKHYQQKTISVDPAIETDADGKDQIVDEVVSSNKEHNGYGFALSYALISKVTVLTSAEKAIRLPNETEIFGNDGDNVVANSSINPEQSNNYNVGFRLGTFSLRKHNFGLSANFFTRNIKDRIGLPIETSLNVNDELILYVNQGSGSSKGVDAQLDYNYNRNFGLNFNISRFNLTVENRGVEIDVPNTPFFTMNGSLRYTFNNWIQNNSRLNLFCSFYFTEEFSYLVPQGSNTVGDDFFKVPEQFTHDAGLSYTFPNKAFTMSCDVKNIFDKPVYDNLSVQKAGRAVYLKLNYTINSF